MSPHEHVIVQGNVDELLWKGFIRESMSTCAIPTFLVPKKDRSWRIYVDNKWINQITVKYWFPIPTIRDLLDQFNGT